MINHSNLPSLSKKALNDAPKENRYAVSENLSDRFSSEGYYCFETQERGMNAIFILIGLYLHEGPKKNYLTDKSYGEKQLSEFKSKYKDKIIKLCEKDSRQTVFYKILNYLSKKYLKKDIHYFIWKDGAFYKEKVISYQTSKQAAGIVEIFRIDDRFYTRLPLQEVYEDVSIRIEAVCFSLTNPFVRSTYFNKLFEMKEIEELENNIKIAIRNTVEIYDVKELCDFFINKDPDNFHLLRMLKEDIQNSDYNFSASRLSELKKSLIEGMHKTFLECIEEYKKNKFQKIDIKKKSIHKHIRLDKMQLTQNKREEERVKRKRSINLFKLNLQKQLSEYAIVSNPELKEEILNTYSSDSFMELIGTVPELQPLLDNIEYPESVKSYFKVFKEVTDKLLSPITPEESVMKSVVFIQAENCVLNKLIKEERINEKISDKDIREISIMVSGTVYLDSDIELFGKNLIITCDTFYVIKSACINVSGLDAEQHKRNEAKNGASIRRKVNRAIDSKSGAMPGANGKNGLPGGDSGNIFIEMKNHEGMEKLTIISNGGKGGDGQQGGKGENGKDGERGEDGEEIDKSTIFTIGRNAALQKGSPGTSGSPGGDGGLSGMGGIGGEQGIVIINNKGLAKDKKYVKDSDNLFGVTLQSRHGDEGKASENGKGGSGGKGGEHGCDRGQEWKTLKFGQKEYLGTLRIKAKKKIGPVVNRRIQVIADEDETRQRKAKKGKEGKTSDRKPNKKIEAKIERKRFLSINPVESQCVVAQKRKKTIRKTGSKIEKMQSEQKGFESELDSLRKEEKRLNQEGKVLLERIENVKFEIDDAVNAALHSIKSQASQSVKAQEVVHKLHRYENKKVPEYSVSHKYLTKEERSKNNIKKETIELSIYEQLILDYEPFLNVDMLKALEDCLLYLRSLSFEDYDCFVENAINYLNKNIRFFVESRRDEIEVLEYIFENLLNDCKNAFALYCMDSSILNKSHFLDFNFDKGFNHIVDMRRNRLPFNKETRLYLIDFYSETLSLSDRDTINYLSELIEEAELLKIIFEKNNSIKMVEFNELIELYRYFVSSYKELLSKTRSEILNIFKGILNEYYPDCISEIPFLISSDLIGFEKIEKEYKNGMFVYFSSNKNDEKRFNEVFLKIIETISLYCKKGLNISRAFYTKGNANNLIPNLKKIYPVFKFCTFDLNDLENMGSRLNEILNNSEKLNADTVVFLMELKEKVHEYYLENYFDEDRSIIIETLDFKKNKASIPVCNKILNQLSDRKLNISFKERSEALGSILNSIKTLEDPVLWLEELEKIILEKGTVLSTHGNMDQNIVQIFNIENNFEMISEALEEIQKVPLINKDRAHWFDESLYRIKIRIKSERYDKIELYEILYKIFSIKIYLMESDLSENSNAYNECNDILEVLLNKLKNNFKSFYTRSVVKFKKQYFELNDLFKNIKEIRETLINIEDNSYEFSNECPIEYLIDKYYKILIFSHQNNIDFPEIIYLISQNIRELNSSMKGEKFNLNVKDESLVKNYLNNLNQIRKKLNDVVFQFFSKDLNINGINESERTEFIIYYTYAMLSGINKTEKNDLKLYYLKLLTDFYIPETNLNLSEYAEIYFIKILNFVSPIVHKKGNSIFTHICDNLKSWKNLKNINSHNQLLSIFRIDVEEDKPTDFFYDLLKNVNLSIQKHYFDRNFKQKSRNHFYLELDNKIQNSMVNYVLNNIFDEKEYYSKELFNLKNITKKVKKIDSDKFNKNSKYFNYIILFWSEHCCQLSSSRDVRAVLKIFLGYNGKLQKSNKTIFFPLIKNCLSQFIDLIQIESIYYSDVTKKISKIKKSFLIILDNFDLNFEQLKDFFNCLSKISNTKDKGDKNLHQIYCYALKKFLINYFDLHHGNNKFLFEYIKFCSALVDSDDLISVQSLILLSQLFEFTKFDFQLLSALIKKLEVLKNVIDLKNNTEITTLYKKIEKKLKSEIIKKANCEFTVETINRILYSNMSLIKLFSIFELNSGKSREEIKLFSKVNVIKQPNLSLDKKIQVSLEEVSGFLYSEELKLINFYFKTITEEIELFQLINLSENCIKCHSLKNSSIINNVSDLIYARLLNKLFPSYLEEIENFYMYIIELPVEDNYHDVFKASLENVLTSKSYQQEQVASIYYCINFLITQIKQDKDYVYLEKFKKSLSELFQYQHAFLLFYNRARGEGFYDLWFEIIEFISYLEKPVNYLTILFNLLDSQDSAHRIYKELKAQPQIDPLGHHLYQLVKRQLEDFVSQDETATEKYLSDLRQYLRLLRDNYELLDFLRIKFNSELELIDQNSRIDPEILLQILRHLSEMHINESLLSELKRRSIFSWADFLHKAQIKCRLEAIYHDSDARSKSRKNRMIQYVMRLTKTIGLKTVSDLLGLIEDRSLSRNEVIQLVEFLKTLSVSEWALSDNLLQTLSVTSIENWIESLYEQYPVNKKSGELELDTLIQVTKYETKSDTSKVNAEELLHSFKENILLIREYLNKQNAVWLKNEKLLADLTSDDFLRFPEYVKSQGGINWVEENIIYVMAVIGAAVRACYDFYPRNTQYLALLLFLNGSNSSHGLLGQVSTGEGKTLMIAMFSIIQVLSGCNVNVVTSANVLAIDHSNENKKLFKLFGFKVSNNCDPEAEQDIDERKQRYTRPIVYGDIGSFQRDILFTECLDENIVGHRENEIIIVDEVDSMLLDKGDNILYLSHSIPDLRFLRELYINIWLCVSSQTVQSDSEDDLIKQISLMLRQKISTHEMMIPYHLTEFVDRRIPVLIKNALTALQINEDNEYIIKQLDHKNSRRDVTQVVSIDKDTGVEQMNSEWGNGLHQFLQLKHTKPFHPESLKSVFMSNFNYFRRYTGRIYGLTGTIGSASDKALLKQLYDVDLFYLPRYKIYRFVEEPAQIALTQQAWMDAVTKEVDSKINQGKINQGRAVLVICDSIDKVKRLKAYLVESEILQAEQVRTYLSSDDKIEIGTKERPLQPGDVIIATNIAGRGMDLITSAELEADKGLHVIFSYLPDNDRVGKQGLGRTGRSGNEGSGVYIIEYPYQMEFEEIIEIRDRLQANHVEMVRKKQLQSSIMEEKLFDRYKVLFADIRTRLLEDTALNKYKNGYVDIQLKALSDYWAFALDSFDPLIYPEFGNIDQDLLETKFDEFKKEMFQHLEKSDFVKFCYAPFDIVKLGRYFTSHTYLKEAIECFDKVIKEFPLHNEIAHYYKVYALGLVKKPDRKLIKYHLQEARKGFQLRVNDSNRSEMLFNIIIECTGESDKGRDTNEYSQHLESEIEIYSQFIQSIDKLLGRNFKLEDMDSITGLQDPNLSKKLYRTLIENDTLVRPLRLSKKVDILKSEKGKIIFNYTCYQGEEKSEEKIIKLPVQYAHLTDSLFEYFKNLLEGVDEEAKHSVRKIGSMKNPVGKPNNKGYIRHEVEADGACGYTAFGITREGAYRLIQEHLHEVRDLLKPVVKAALFSEEFIDYVQSNGYATETSIQTLIQAFDNYQQAALQGGNMSEDIENNLLSHVNDLIIAQAYIDYDIKDKRIDAGWSHPCILQALAHIQNIELHIWRLGEQEVLIPHTLPYEDYSIYNPEQADNRGDVLFVNNNHFERLEFYGYEHQDGVPNEDESVYPVNSSQNRKINKKAIEKEAFLNQDQLWSKLVEDGLLKEIASDRFILSINLKNLHDLEFGQFGLNDNDIKARLIERNGKLWEKGIFTGLSSDEFNNVEKILSRFQMLSKERMGKLKLNLEEGTLKLSESLEDYRIVLLSIVSQVLNFDDKNSQTIQLSSSRIPLPQTASLARDAFWQYLISQKIIKEPRINFSLKKIDTNKKSKRQFKKLEEAFNASINEMEDMPESLKESFKVLAESLIGQLKLIPDFKMHLLSLKDSYKGQDIPSE